MVKRLTDDNFKKETSNGLSLVAFIAPWCPPCKRQAPVIDELDSEVGKLITVGRLDTGFHNKEELIDMVGKYID